MMKNENQFGLRYCPRLAPLTCVMFLIELKIGYMPLLCRVLHFYRLIEVLRPLCIFTQGFTWPFHCSTNDTLGQQGMAIPALSWPVLLRKIYSLISSVGWWTASCAAIHHLAINLSYSWTPFNCSNSESIYMTEGKKQPFSLQSDHQSQWCTFIFSPNRSSEGENIASKKVVLSFKNLFVI